MAQQTGSSGGGGDLAGMLGSYTTPLPSILTSYMNSLMKGGFLDLPSFKQLFGSYKDIATKNADQQAAQITESLGSQGGGRYSSALLGAQSKLRENTSLDLANAAAGYQSQLAGQQYQQLMGPASLAYGASEAGMNRMWSDFLRRTSPPPLLSGAIGLSSSYGLPATIVA